MLEKQPDHNSLFLIYIHISRTSYQKQCIANEAYVQYKRLY